MKNASHILTLFIALLLGVSILHAVDAVDHLKGSDPVSEEATAPEEAEAQPDLNAVESTVLQQPRRFSNGEKVSVYVIPITDAISKPNEFILRRGIKEAIAEQIDVLILDINTPGGRGDVMLEIMQKVSRFQGLTIAYVNDEAISAGAFISFSADEIWYTPTGVIGAAAVVSGGGEEIPETMKQKIDSYIMAKTRAIGGDHPYKAQVMQAMMDADYVLEIDGEVLKSAGTLLSLTAKEAMRTFGDPPHTLFGEGIAEDIDSLLTQRFGEGNFTVKRFEITWSEELAKYMDSIAPVLIGLAFLALFIEFKTPGFGVFGTVGILLILTVFSTNYVVGLAGYEVLIFFFIGLALVAVELFLLPGTGIFLISGVALMVGSILWSLADLWPKPDGDGIIFDPEAFIRPMTQLSLGMILSVVGLIALWKLLPETTLLKRVILATASATVSPVIAHGGSRNNAQLPDLGAIGTVVSTLRPTGQIEFAGNRFEASTSYGSIDKGEKVVVIGYKNFYLLVEKYPS